jgi:two-component system response regulator NreC
MSDGDTVTIVLVDDHEVVRAGLRLLLDAEPGFKVVAEASDVDAALRTVLGYKPSVLVLDLGMPGGRTALDAIPEVGERSNATRVVVLTMREEPEFARRALDAGALGYVLKEAAGAELVEAVRRAAAGDTYLNPRLGAQLAARPARALRTARRPERARGGGPAAHRARPHQSPRSGASSTSRCAPSSPTARVQQKLGRSSRAELVRYALEHRLLDEG